MTRRRDDDWAEARRLCRLSSEDVRMARALGMSPRGLIRNRPSPSQRWKAPVAVWVRDLYHKRFGGDPWDERPRPGPVRPPGTGRGSQKIRNPERQAYAERDDFWLDPEGGDESWLDPENARDFWLDTGDGCWLEPEDAEAFWLDNPDGSSLDEPGGGPERLEPEDGDSGLEAEDVDSEFEAEDADDARAESPPGLAEEAAESDALLLRRQEQFRAAADYECVAFAALPAVERVALFGSVARPLEREVPRFSRLRRAGIAVWHECKDVDLAVWVSRTDDLKALQKARGRALNALYDVTAFGVAHHQVDVFLFEPGTDRYLGRLCHFGTCPKGKPECRVPGCGAALFLRQHERFAFDARRSLAPSSSTLLFDRAGSFGPPSLDRWEPDVPF